MVTAIFMDLEGIFILLTGGKFKFSRILVFGDEEYLLTYGVMKPNPQ